MKSFGETIHAFRKDKRLSLKTVSAGTGIDPAVLSKMENGLRKASRDQVENLSVFFGVDLNDLLVIWLSDRLFNEIRNEENALDAIQVAEQKVLYMKPGKWNKSEVVTLLRKFFREDKRVKKAWLFGSYATGNEHAGSDLDLLVSYSPDATGSIFDYADLTAKLEKLLHLKVDLVEDGFVKPFARARVDKERILIYG
jgi:predicted nucleotidyltransferase